MILQGKIEHIDHNENEVLGIGGEPIADYLVPYNGQEMNIGLIVDDSPIHSSMLEDYAPYGFSGVVRAVFGIDESSFDDETEVDIDNLQIPEFTEAIQVGDTDLLDVLHNQVGMNALLVFQSEPINLDEVKRQLTPRVPQPADLDLQLVGAFSGDGGRLQTLFDVVFELATNAPVIYRDDEYRVVRLGEDDFRYYYITDGRFERLGDVVPRALVDRLAVQSQYNSYSVNVSAPTKR